MQRGRTLILVGVLLAVLAILLAVVWGRFTGTPTQQAAPTAQAIPTKQIVVALQPMSRGTQIITAAVGLLDWPERQIPPNSFVDPKLVVGKFAKIDIPQGIPVLPSMLADSPAAAAAAGGSAAAIAIQPGLVGVAFPLRSTYPENSSLPYDKRDKDVSARLMSVAYAVQPGDRVDVMSCFWIYELDKEFQTRRPNELTLIDTETRQPAGTIKPGRAAVSPGGLPAIEAPSEAQIPRMVCQWMIQNARVLGLGDWGQPTGAAPAAAQPAAGGQPTPTPAPPLPQVLTLEIEPQDALVLKYARETGAQLDLALRAANEKEPNFPTVAVTLQYIFERFQVSIPAKLDYAIAGGGDKPVGAQQP